MRFLPDLKLFAVSFLLLGLTPSLQAGVTMEWASNTFGDNFQSDGTTILDSSFVFELGSFKTITPTSDNMEDWEGDWEAFGTATYNESFRRFSDNKVLDSNDAPFLTTTRAYIWGKNGTGSGSEWILMGSPDWKWPAANPGGPPPFPTNWSVFNLGEDDVVVGEANAEDFHMKTARVQFGDPYQDWAEMVFEEGDPSGPDEDADGDGWSNYDEFVSGTNPKSGTSFPRFTEFTFSPEKVEAKVAALEGRTYEFQRWVNTVNGTPEWVSLSTVGPLAADDSELIFEDTALSSKKAFYRVRISFP